MRAARIVYLKRARTDVREQFEHRGSYGDRAAKRFADQLADAVEPLRTFPEVGTPRPDLAEGLRSLAIKGLRTTLYYVYTVEDGEPVVSVLRVLRQERDVSGADFE